MCVITVIDSIIQKRKINWNSNRIYNLYTIFKSTMPCSAVTLSLATISAIISVSLLSIAFSTDNWLSYDVKRNNIQVRNGWIFYFITIAKRNCPILDCSENNFEQYTWISTKWATMKWYIVIVNYLISISNVYLILAKWLWKYYNNNLKLHGRTYHTSPPIKIIVTHITLIVPNRRTYKYVILLYFATNSSNKQCYVSNCLIIWMCDYFSL